MLPETVKYYPSPSAQRHGEVCLVEVKLHAFLISASDGGEFHGT
jgi:hypothetical protein